MLWCSDLTHYREQAEVAKYLNPETFCFITNKKDIFTYIKNQNSTLVNFITFGENSSVNGVSKILNRYFPNLEMALIGNDFRPDDALIGKAIHKLHIKYGVITHGLNYLHQSLNQTKADYYFVWSEEEKQRFINQGVSTRTKLLVSGSPYFHSLTNNNLNIAHDWATSFKRKYAHNDKLILLCLSGPGGLNSNAQHQQQVNEINSIAKQLGLIFSANLHRKDRASYYQGLENLQLIANEDKHEHVSKLVPILSCADIVISSASTSVIEAMCLNKPVVFFDVNPKSYDIPYAKGEFVAVAKNTSELMAQIEQLLTDENHKQQLLDRQQSFLHSHIINEGITPSNFIAQHITQVIQHDS